MSVGLQELTGLWLFLFASLYAAVTEFVAGKLIERFYHKRWWDYSKSKWNLDGYICLPVSLIKGALGYVVVKYANRWVFRLLAILPQLLVHIVAAGADRCACGGCTRLLSAVTGRADTGEVAPSK